MTPTRRDFLKAAGLVGAGFALGGASACSDDLNPKRLLILGGTGFIGPHTVRYALERGHEVSIFTRGRSETELPAGVEHLIGDRNDDHTALEGRTIAGYRRARNSYETPSTTTCSCLQSLRMRSRASGGSTRIASSWSRSLTKTSPGSLPQRVGWTATTHPMG